VKVLGTRDDLDLDTHEEEGEVASVQFGKPDGVLLRGDDESAMRFLLRLMALRTSCCEPVVIGEAFGVNQFAAEFAESLLEASGWAIR
jgi:hypothetical protein